MQNVIETETILESYHPRVVAHKEDGLVGSKGVHALESSNSDKEQPMWCM